MRCPQCRHESENPLVCSRCGLTLPRPTRTAPRRPGPPQARRRWAPQSALFSFVFAFLALHVAALGLLHRGASVWQGLGIACAAAFLAGLLVGALQVIAPLDTEALGEVVSIPSTLPREAPVLLVAVFLGMVFTPLAGLASYLIYAYVRDCLDDRVLLIFGLTILSSLIVSLPFSGSWLAISMLYSRLMLPAAMVGWAFSSFFRSDVW